jgi:hypothetical protein
MSRRNLELPCSERSTELCSKERPPTRQESRTRALLELRLLLVLGRRLAT